MLRRTTLLTLTFATFSAATASAQDALDPAVAGDLTLTQVVQNLGGPTSAQFLPDGRIIITQQSGEILVAPGAGGAATQIGSVPVAGGGGERGLLELVIDPEFATSNRLYIYYSSGNSQSVGYVTIDANDTISAPTPLLSGLSSTANHDGGGLAFGPDGYIYIGVGDTGNNCGCAPGENMQNYYPTCLTRLHGKILRIDRDGNIPATNPLVGVTDVPSCGNNMSPTNPPDLVNTAAPRTEIYNWGVRNPWRIGFDSQTGWLWVADVGEVTFEEINISKEGGLHFGWPYREGDQGQPRTVCPTNTPAAVGDCAEPAYFYPHAEAPANGQGSITGGVFSNHCSWPTAYAGLYWFSDYNKSRVWTVTPNATRDGIDGERTIMVRGAGGPVHFFNGPDGSIYYVSINDGEIWRIAPTVPVICGDPDAGQADAVAPADTGVDSGVPPGDTGVPPGDTGVPPGDTGVSPTDSGVTADSGGAVDTGAGTGGEDEGCGCTTTTSNGLAGLGLFGALIALSMVRRRR